MHYGVRHGRCKICSFASKCSSRHACIRRSSRTATSPKRADTGGLCPCWPASRIAVPRYAARTSLLSRHGVGFCAKQRGSDTACVLQRAGCSRGPAAVLDGRRHAPGRETAQLFGCKRRAAHGFAYVVAAQSGRTGADWAASACYRSLCFCGDVTGAMFDVKDVMHDTRRLTTLVVGGKTAAPLKAVAQPAADTAL